MLILYNFKHYLYIHRKGQSVVSVLSATEHSRLTAVGRGLGEISNWNSLSTGLRLSKAIEKSVGRLKEVSPSTPARTVLFMKGTKTFIEDSLFRMTLRRKKICNECAIIFLTLHYINKCTKDLSVGVDQPHVSSIG